MKSKKLAILILILFVVTLVIVLASTIFTLKTISFNFLNQKNMLAGTLDDDYIKNITVPYGDSIFLIDKDELTNNLEKNNAYMQVIGIETTFPSNIVIHASEREELYAIKVEDDKYAITDKSLKILRYCNNAYLTHEELRPIVVEIEYDDVNFKDYNYQVCDFVNIDHVSNILKSVATAFEKAGYSITSLKGFATKITLNESGYFKENNNSTGYDLQFVKTVEIDTKYGIKLSINDAYNYIDTKISLALSAYEVEHDKHNTTGEILVYEKSDTIVGVYRKD